MPPKIAISMATYNGERFLKEQLASFEAQTYPHWDLFAHDDQSTDGTESLVKQCRGGAGIYWKQNSKKLDAPYNFILGLRDIPKEYEYYAWSDQDDIWFEDKLERAIKHLNTLEDKAIPAMYCSRTALIDEIGNDLGLSPLFSRKPSFSNALVQSIAGGNTMVFNEAARDLLDNIPTDLKLITHDWPFYQLVTGAGGYVYYDPQPTLLYRQHTSNRTGANTGIMAKLKRIDMLLKGSFKEWNDENFKALSHCLTLLTPENKNKFTSLFNSRKQALPGRIYGLLRSGVYRQTIAGNIALLAAGILGKI